MCLTVWLALIVGCEGTMEFEGQTSPAFLETSIPQKSDELGEISTFVPHTPRTSSNAEESSSDILEDIPTEEVDDPATPGLIVTFEISPGTSSGNWNSMETAPTVYVDQILRIVNNDSEPHRLHVPTSGPFPHGQSIPPGAQVEYLVRAPWPLESRAGMYDHEHGPSAGFWLQAIE